MPVSTNFWNFPQLFSKEIVDSTAISKLQFLQKFLLWRFFIRNIWNRRDKKGHKNWSEHDTDLKNGLKWPYIKVRNSQVWATKMGCPILEITAHFTREGPSLARIGLSIWCKMVMLTLKFSYVCFGGNIKFGHCNLKFGGFQCFPVTNRGLGVIGMLWNIHFYLNLTFYCIIYKI